MPHTTGTKLILSDAFNDRVSIALDLKKFKKYLEIKNKITDDGLKKAKKLNAHLKWHPELHNQIVGFDVSTGIILLKENTTSVPENPPQRFTSDILLGIVPFLPYPALGRLAKSCKWMNGNITQEQADKAVKRGQEIIRNITLFTEPSGRQMIRFFSVDEEQIEFGRILDGSQVFIIRFRNRTFMGSHPHLIYSLGLSKFFSTVVESILLSTGGGGGATTTTGVGNTCAWFQLVNATDPRSLHIRIMFRSENVRWRLITSSATEHFDVGFHEYID